jgi:hypothetical protein
MLAAHVDLDIHDYLPVSATPDDLPISLMTPVAGRLEALGLTA